MMKKLLRISAAIGISLGVMLGTAGIAMAAAYVVGVGGTGWTKLQANTILLGNGTSPVATTSIPLAASFGGTGATSLSGIAKGNGASAFTVAINGTDYTLITANTCSAGNHVSAITAAGVISCTADSGGGSSFSYPFSYFNNIGTTSALMVLASTTIGNGTGTGGLTISGNATTTGNAYFASNVGISTSSPDDSLSLYSPTNTVASLIDFAGPNGKGGGIGVANGFLYFNSANGGTTFRVANGKIRMGDGSSVDNIELDGGSISNQGNGGGLTFDNSANASLSANLTVSGSATTTGTAYFGSNVGIGTTTPFANLSISDNTANKSLNAFVISSSTASATSSLFKVDNVGNTTAAGILDLSQSSISPTGHGLYNGNNDWRFNVNGSQVMDIAGGPFVSFGGATGGRNTGEVMTVAASQTGTNGPISETIWNDTTAGSSVSASLDLSTSHTTNNNQGSLTVNGSTNTSGNGANSFTINGGGGILDLQTNGTNALNINSSQFVGIGTTSPGSALSIQGNIFLAGNLIATSTATSSFASDLNIPIGHCYQIGGTCIGGGSGSGTVGSGTIGQFPYYAANGSTLTATSSIFLATNGAIGIATTTPGYSSLLGVTGNGYFSGTLYANNFFDTSVSGNTCIGESGGLIGTSNCVSSLASANGSLTISSPTGAVDASINTTHPNFFSALQNFTNASTSELTATSSVWLTGIGGAGFVQLDANGKASSAALTSGQVTTALGYTPFGGTNPLPIANGGTNATSFTTSGNSIYYDGTRLSTALATAAATTPYASSTAISSTYASSTKAYVGTLNLPNLTSTQCLQEISGVVSGTGSACSGGGITSIANGGTATSTIGAKSTLYESDGTNVEFVATSSSLLGIGTGRTVYTSAGSFTFNVPASVTQVFARGWGGGSGPGGGPAGTGASCAGGAGGYFEGWFPVTPGGTVSITIGAAGIGGTQGNTGGGGGNTSFGAAATANGGASGACTGGVGTSFGSNGGTATGGDLDLTGGIGGLKTDIATSPVVNLVGLGGSAPMGGLGGSGQCGAGGTGVTSGSAAGQPVGAGCMIIDRY